MTLILPFNLFIHYTLQRSTNMTPTLLQQRKEERKRNHFQISTHSVLQAGPANHAANTCKLADAIQKLRFYLTRHASNPAPPLVSLLTLLWFPPICASDEHPGAPALFDVWADPALRDCGPCAVSMKAIKNLNLCHNQNRPCIHFFLNPSSWQNCKGAVLDCPHWCLHSKRQSPCQSVHWLN